MGGQGAVVDHCGKMLQNGLYLLGDLVVLQLQNFIAVIEQYVLMDELEPAHLAE